MNSYLNILIIFRTFYFINFSILSQLQFELNKESDLASFGNVAFSAIASDAIASDVQSAFN